MKRQRLLPYYETKCDDRDTDEESLSYRDRYYSSTFGLCCGLTRPFKTMSGDHGSLNLDRRAVAFSPFLGTTDADEH